MAGVYSRIKVWIAGEVLTAADLNGEFNNEINNAIPASIDDYSDTISQMQSIADPGEVGTESLATTLSGELERIRFTIKELKLFLKSTIVQWYESLSGAIDTSLTFSGALLTFSGAKALFSGSSISVSAALNYAVTSGTDTYTATLDPAITALTVGAEYKIKFVNSNTIANATLNLNGLGAKDIKQSDGSALVIGEIVAGGQFTVRYDGTNMLLLLAKPLGVSYAETTGTGSAYVLTLVPAITSYDTGAEYKVKFILANTVIDPTLNIDGLGSKTIKGLDGSTMVAGQIVANSQITVRYDGTNMLLLGHSASPSFRVHRGGLIQNNISGIDKVEWTTEDFDTNSDFDTGLFRFTPTVAGKYLFAVNITMQNTGTGDVINLFVYKNGSSLTKVHTQAADTTGYLSFSVVVDANGSTDYFEIFFENQSGDTADIDPLYWSGSKIG